MLTGIFNRTRMQNDGNLLTQKLLLAGWEGVWQAARMKPIFLLMSLLTAIATAAAPFKALIVDGQNNHDFRATTPHLKKLLEETGLFTVDVATSPGKGGDMASFKPKFEDYKIVVSNYNGEPWSDETKAAFEKFVKDGGGFVCVHAADNSFPEWPAFNEMIGLGGWGGRNEKSGPYLRLRDGAWKPDMTPGTGGSHGTQHPFVMTTRMPEHPIMQGLPAKWMHAKDELYDRLRGPAKDLTILASANASKEMRGSGEEEPLLMVRDYGKGRVFHTALGHNNGPDLSAQNCVGFITTFQRGAEWAASGKVTQKVPADFPREDAVSLRTAAK
jgi:type 1 glutamine amidotransferase